MRVLKFTEGWTRRHFLEQIGKGVAAAGVIAPLWDTIARTGLCEAAYPPELLSIEAYTKGRLKPGDVLDAGNVDVVKDLLDPATYLQIKTDGRVIDLLPTETDLNKLMIPAFVDATVRNRGLHAIGGDGNVYTREGKPWIGGNAFPEPRTADEILLSHSLAWGKHDAEGVAVREWDTDAAGETAYTYDMYFVTWQTVGRVILDPKPYVAGYEHDLRITATVTTAPQDLRGMGMLTIWSYDQHSFPNSWAFHPSTKRIRSVSPMERFNPTLPGSTSFTSDARMLGDPLLTWGNFKLVSKGPMLACVSRGAYTGNPGWEMPLCGGKNGRKYFRTRFELVPEVYVVELAPIRYTNCPYSKKLVWYDARTLVPLTMIGYDKAGEMMHQHEAGYGMVVPPQPGSSPNWAFTYVLAMDMKNRKLTRIQLLPEATGGYRTMFDDSCLFSGYCSLDALRRLGR